MVTVTVNVVYLHRPVSKTAPLARLIVASEHLPPKT